jgi:hypothetical protein
MGMPYRRGMPACQKERQSFLNKFCRKNLADNTRDAMEPLTLAIGTFHGIGLREVHPFGNPAFRAVGKGGRFHKFTPDPEFPAVDTESAVLWWLFFIRETLYRAHGHRQDSIFIGGHNKSLRISAEILFYPLPYKPGESQQLKYH